MIRHSLAARLQRALGVLVQAILTDRERAFCECSTEHLYALVLALHGIKNRTIEISSPRANAFIERMNRMLLNERLRIAGRQTWYLSPNTIQRDLDTFFEIYNFKRSHQGYRLNGRTPPLRRWPMRSVGGNSTHLPDG